MISPDIFHSIAHDFNCVASSLREHGVPLASWDGTGYPQITDETIAFNGLEHCGHQPNSDIIIPWPSPSACGVAESDDAQIGCWSAGVELTARTCDGSCAYETMRLDRVVQHARPDESNPNNVTSFCKTAFRSYDIAVTALLIIAKHYLGDDIQIATDGEDANWLDGKLVCAMTLGYGLEYKICDYVLTV